MNSGASGAKAEDADKRVVHEVRTKKIEETHYSHFFLQSKLDRNVK
jgi:hypothetical protein